MKVKGRIANGAIKEVMRKADAIESENEHMKEIIVHNTEYVDIEVINVFPVNNITSLIIKCQNGCIQHGMRDNKINKRS